MWLYYLFIYYRYFGYLLAYTGNTTASGFSLVCSFPCLCDELIVKKELEPSRLDGVKRDQRGIQSLVEDLRVVLNLCIRVWGGKDRTCQWQPALFKLGLTPNPRTPT
jgi:hypothetical protein